MSDCGICLVSIRLSPFGNGNIEPAPVVSLCGHFFHLNCWTQGVDNDPRCPQCRAPARVEDFVDVFPRDDTALDELKNEVTSLNEEKDGLKEELDTLKLEVEQLREDRRRESGARINFGQFFEDSLCFNCESKLHRSLECPHPAYVRNQEEQNGGKYDGRPYKFQCSMSGPPAGEIINKYQRKFKMEFNREQIQVVFSFVFFDSCCWNCGGPFHEKKECKNKPAPGIKNVAKLMHLENHPLTDEEIEKRIEKFHLYAKN